MTMTIDDELKMYENCPMRDKVVGEELNTLKFKCNSAYDVCPMQAKTSANKYCWYDLIKDIREKNEYIYSIKKWQG